MEKFNGRNGPWHYDDELSGVYSESCRFVCDVTDKHNGILIAAAPELLEALQYINHAINHGTQMDIVNGQEMAESAINKALGE